MIVIVRSLRRRRTDLLDVGESTLDVGEQTVGETTRRRNDRNSNQHCETIYKNITHSYLQYSIIKVAATKLWAIKNNIIYMSLSWMLWQYTKICIESFHHLLNGVITESHLVKTYFDDAALILVMFLGTTLLCCALRTKTPKISLRRTFEEIRGRHVVYCTAGSHAASSFLKCSAPGFLDF